MNPAIFLACECLCYMCHQALTSLHRKALRAKSVRVDGAVDVHVNTSSEDSGTSGDEESTDVSWLRVLVVDDSRVNRLVLARMLKKLGVRQVDTAADGAEAVDMASCECRSAMARTRAAEAAL